MDKENVFRGFINKKTGAIRANWNDGDLCSPHCPHLNIMIFNREWSDFWRKFKLPEVNISCKIYGNLYSKTPGLMSECTFTGLHKIFANKKCKGPWEKWHLEVIMPIKWIDKKNRDSEKWAKYNYWERCIEILESAIDEKANRLIHPDGFFAGLHPDLIKDINKWFDKRSYRHWLIW